MENNTVIVINIDKNLAFVENNPELKFSFHKGTASSEDCRKCCFTKFRKCNDIPCTTISRVDGKNGHFEGDDTKSGNLIYNLQQNQLEIKQL